MAFNSRRIPPGSESEAVVLKNGWSGGGGDNSEPPAEIGATPPGAIRPL